MGAWPAVVADVLCVSKCNSTSVLLVKANIRLVQMKELAGGSISQLTLYLVSVYNWFCFFTLVKETVFLFHLCIQNFNLEAFVDKKWGKHNSWFLLSLKNVQNKISKFKFLKLRTLSMLPSGCFVRFLLSAVYLCKITSVLIQQRLHIDDCPTHEDASGEV